MNALPPIVIVAPGAELPPEAERLAARLRCKILRPSELALWLRHLLHAFQKEETPDPAIRNRMGEAKAKPRIRREKRLP